MRTTTPFLFATIALFFFVVPAVSFAAPLTGEQVSAIVGLLQAFGVDQATIAQVEQTLGAPAGSPVPAPPAVLQVPTTSSPYGASSIGFDVSYGTRDYPATSFGFGIVSVTRGKAFVNNPRLVSEFNWAKFGSAVAPTLYMNLNAPYGSSVAGHTSTPKTCPSSVSTSTEPTACEGYNYGYNAARDAYGYAKTSGTTASLWWLDIEEANSWSDTLAVNDATIQGAIDYLNTQNVRVGVYSMGFMWNAIAGSTFVPTQTVSGVAVSTPTWLPVGIETLVGAINSCVTRASFISGNPIWIIQYVADATAIDQNLAC